MIQLFKAKIIFYLVIFLLFPTRSYSTTSFDGILVLEDPDINKNAIYDISSLKQFADVTDQKPKKKFSLPTSFSVWQSFVYKSFNDQALSNLTASVNQSSPFSAGVGGVVQLFRSFRLRTNLSYTKYQNVITQGDENYDSQEVIIPAEIDIKSSLIYAPPRKNYGLTLGIDFLKISSFNTESLQLQNDLRVKNYSIYYITAGATYRFSLINHKGYATLNYALSFMAKDDTESSSIKAEKLEFNLKVQLWKSVFAHGFYTYHQILNNTLLNINKMGIGIGFSF